MPTALIADDEAMLRAQLKARLAECWPELAVIAEAANGAEALALFDVHRPDIVFLDVMMPEMDGLEALQLIVGPAEELFWRGLVQNALMGRFGRWPGAAMRCSLPPMTNMQWPRSTKARWITC